MSNIGKRIRVTNGYLKNEKGKILDENLDNNNYLVLIKTDSGSRWKSWLNHPDYGSEIEFIEEEFVIMDGYTKITFEQFKKYVLKQEDKKIIGYKVPHNLCNGIIKAGSIYVKRNDPTSYNYSPDGSSNGFNLPKEIVEKWEPVYESVEEDIFIDKFKVEFKENATIAFGNRSWSNLSLQDLHRTMKTIKSKAIFLTINNEDIEVDFETIEKIYKRINKT